MPTATDIKWFKKEFGQRMKTAANNTPFTVDMLTAIACQETGYIWANLYKQGIATPQILQLCTGDTIDAKPGGGGRRAFPKTKADLIAHQDGPAMFAVARKLLVDMAAYIPGYGPVITNPNKFCHGYGVFQYDLQFFDQDRAYFLAGGYADFTKSLGKCLTELKAAAQRTHMTGATLSDDQMAAVAIAYNTGSYNPAKGLKQGYYDGQFYYGEYFAKYLALAKSVPNTTPAPGIPLVVANADGVNLRSTPDKISAANILKALATGQPLRAASMVPANGFLEVDVAVDGQSLHGFAWSAYLKPA